MSFVSSYGTTALNPFTATDRYLQLAHPAVADVLLLNEMDSNGGGYTPPQTKGLLSITDRTLSSVVATQATYKKLLWSDLAFVMTLDQWGLLSQLLLAQTPASPITAVDKIVSSAAPITKLVIVELPGGPSVYSSLAQYLVQFSMSEV
jgi:hypothetical protein